MDCPAKSLNVSWAIEGYMSRAIEFYLFDDNGTLIFCIDIGCAARDGKCMVPEETCGMNYNMKLKAVGDKCNSSRSAAHPFSTAPCSLSTSDLAVDVACDSGRASVSWANGAPGVLYSVSAVGDDGAMHECNGSSGDCDLGLLPCGSEYNATVTPSRDGCVGISTAPIAFRTVPCVPQLKAVEIDCLTNSVWVMGSESAGAEDYVITATDDAGGVQTFECNSTSEDLCFLPTLACSKNFTFTIQARNGDCSSAPSNARTIETGPCSPQGVISHVDCEANLVSISWDTVPGAVSYTATLEDFNGGTDCCTSANNSCDISDLPCGQMYFLLVTAEGRTCNSSETRGMARTVPCVPENLDYTLSCTSNLASMSWNHSLGGQLYRVTAVSQDDHVDRCSSHENHCELANLECGKTYSVAVTAEDMDCNSKASNNVSIKTAPCTPQDLSSVVSCGNSTMLVSWADSEGADSYLATVEDSYGQVTSCQATTEGQCSVGTLGCGLIYHVSLVASDGHCDSLSTAVVDTPSVPCVPNNIKAEFDCFLNSALVSWYPSDGAILYVVTGTSVSGHVITCSTAATTHCELEDLECGDSYTVQVLAVGESCNATGQMNGTMGTGPCVPEILSTDYSLSIGQALWARDPGAERYTVEAVTDQGLVSDCATNDTYCALYNMECSQTYTFTLTAYNDQCPSGIAANQTNSMTTEPCPPKNIQVDVQLPTNLAVVQWEPSVGAVSYVATLSGRNGETLQCQTVETFCEVDALECGVIYYAQVIAVGATMNSTESETIQVEAGPCPVENVTVLVDYYNSSAVIAWEPALGATSYEMIAVATSGHQVSCGGSEFDTKCEVVDLECGQTYSITAVSINHQGSVKTETGVTFQTRPCKPENVGVDFQCATWTATLFWADEDGVVLYLGTAVSSSGVKTVCNTSASPCLFTNLDCGETYDFYVEASNDVAISEPSETVSTGTGPCTASDLAAQSSCYDPMVELSWSDTAGAELYTVDVAGNLGYVTSLQTTNTTVEVELPCGQIYTVTVRASDESCPGTVSQSVQYQSGPCVPRDVKSYTACENNIGAVSWAPADGADFYLAFAVGESGSTNNCTTNETSCTWDDLQCGDVYEVVVMAFNEECESLESNTTYIRMASCIPQNVVATFNCSMKVGSLSWDAVSTADFYIATAQSDSGHTIQQSTNDTWAYFSEFSCGVDYFLSVQSVDAHCTSVPSPAAKLQSEPCPPTGVSSYMNCIANIAVVSWNSSVGGEYYAATVTSEEGNTQTCWSDQEQCGIPNLRCGQSYSVSVVASNQACNSDPSPESQLMSVPCVPTNVHVSTMDCSKNEATVTWDASQGALMYTVHAESANNTSSSCETDTLSCMLTGLMCGQAYSVQVVARDNICASLPSPATLFESVPCVPDMGAVVLDCATDTFIADWMFSDGALSYVATALSSGGDVSTCSSNNTNCELGGLQCGQTYTVTVQAENTLCRSLPSNGVMSESAPCRPQGLTTSVNCSTNSIAVQWQQTAGVSYYVEALGLEEDEASCTSSSDRCVLEGLLCGFTYNVSVVAYNDLCNVSSDVLQQNSVPCVPQNVRAALDCESKDVQLTWENTRGALTYRSVAQSVGGFTEVCDSSDTWCTFSQLLCDMNYTFTVAASDGACSSHASAAVEIYTGPCEPQHVMADMFCNNHTGVVSWEEGDGVTSYSVQGYGPDGHSVSCSTEGTSCQLPSMHCGQMYNLTVTAIDGRCNNSQAHVSLNSVPCTPTNVGASLRCSTNTTAVTWERASGADTYTAVALSSDGSHTSTCGNNETHCDLSALQCGTVYNVTVMGEDHVCFGVKSAPASVHTAPCTPQNVTVTEQCAAASMTVSWAANPDAEYFLVSGMSSSGAPLTCNATSTSCSFSALPCGQSYNFIVIAFRDDCPSAPSVPVTTSSAPCVPTNIYAHLDCVTNAAWITFTESAGATGYRVFARAEGVAHNSSGSSASSPCSVPDLKCSTVYNIQLTAENGHCASTPGPDYRLETAPCALTAINATTECDSSVITVQWKVSENMPLYVATAEGHDMSLISCNSTSNSCQLQDAACGMNYTVIVSTSSDKCSSLRSPSYHVQTPPCAPQNVTAVQSCNDSGVIVSYDLSPVPARYVVRVSGAGFSETHNTTLDHCTLSGLPCGQQFQVDVYAFTENCTSPDTTVTYESGPCPPSGLSVVYDCANLSAHLTWDPSQGAGEFFASAQAPTLAPLYCSSADLSCTIDGLVCGQNYSFGVEASDYVCNSSSAAPVHLGSVPCAPTNIRVRMQLMEGSFWAMIWWDRVTCPDVEYQVTIGGHINDNPQTQMQITSYWLERNYFEVPLPTSTTYKINVYARNLGGVSQPSFTKTGVTVPTPPQNVEYDPISSELTWDASVLANLYQVYEVTPLGDIGLCETTTLACSAPGVDQADLRVTASNAAGTSLPSAPTVARRRRDLSGAIMDMDDALVPPTAVSVTPSETSLAVQWSAVRGAAEYVVVVDENKGNLESLVQTTAETELAVHGLQPGTVYCLKVAAKNISQQSLYTENKCISTLKETE
ncbi:uncharacterized protein fndc7b [Eucyclogobius newberryi]|uniref:uncharacterized protein fndc7b n=1 Tax=Eucyclogobius newberryi TaxID=166745 RepID=UPI003B58F116